MRFDTRLKYLRIALTATGLFLAIAVGPQMLGLWPSAGRGERRRATRTTRR